MTRPPSDDPPRPVLLDAAAHAVVGGDEGQQVLREEVAVLVGVSAAHLPVAGRRVFGEAVFAGVGDADHDEWLDLAGFDHGVGRLGNLPGSSRDERGSGIEEVLSVLQIQDGILAIGFFVIARRQIYRHIAVVRQEAAVELGVRAQARMRRSVCRRRSVQEESAGGESDCD